MLKQVLEVCEVLDAANASGEAVAQILRAHGGEAQVERVVGEGGATEFVRCRVEGLAGRAQGGAAPTLGVIGRLGGVGARPGVQGLVSDADGAVVALAVALKLLDMRRRGDRLAGDVLLATHVCPEAPVVPHEPVPFMSSPVDMATMNRMEVDPAMDAVVAVDTTRGNRIANRRGFAVTPVVRQGWILPVPAALLDLVEIVTGEPPLVLPLATQDITPYGNGLRHVNSILQPSTATPAPVLGVALTAATVVPGSASGATQEVDDELAARFVVEVAKAFTSGRLAFYDAQEADRLDMLYGPQRHLQAADRGR